MMAEAVPETIVINGRPGKVVHFDDDFRPVPKEQATTAKVIFDDGSVTFFSVRGKDDEVPE